MAAGGGAAGADNNGSSLEYTPTWAVAVVCPLIVIMSFLLERAIYFLGQELKRRNGKLLLETLERVKEELMLLGFMSFLVPAFKGVIGKICVPIHLTHHMLPCKQRAEIATATGHCAAKGKVPLLSQEGFDDLDTFIFVLAIVHFFLSLITVILGEAKIYQWKQWEDSIKDGHNSEWGPMFTLVPEHAFIRERLQQIGNHSAILGWLVSFFKQFRGSVTKSDYITLRRSFIYTHCRGSPNFGFHRYMVGALEDEYKTVVGIRYQYLGELVNAKTSSGIRLVIVDIVTNVSATFPCALGLYCQFRVKESKILLLRVSQGQSSLMTEDQALEGPDSTR